MKVAVIGATGLVGTKMCQLLEERNFPVTEFIPVASIKSVGKKILFKGQAHTIVSMQDALAKAPAIALFSAGGGLSLSFAEQFAALGTYVIDNSSAWRMSGAVKLIVPEVNGDLIEATDRIIANPNCSTIQLVMVLNPLHKKYGIKRVVISTYQSVTGTGAKAVAQLMEERAGKKATEPAYPYQIDLNVIPQIDVFFDNDYTKEEMKLVMETKKIMGDNSIRLTATAVRIPVIGGHSESVNIEFEHEFNVGEIKALLAKTPGVVVEDDRDKKLYPMPLHAHEKDEVFVGRIRRDESLDNALNLWIVSDNLRKGAATNTVQIAEILLEKGFVKA